MQAYQSFKPLSMLYSLGNIKQVESPKSQRGAKLFPQPFTSDSLTSIPSKTSEEKQSLNNVGSQQHIEEELENSIDDLFNKIQRIKSQFTPNQQVITPLKIKHTNSMKCQPRSYEKDWKNVLQTRDPNRPNHNQENQLFKKVSAPIILSSKKITIEDFELGKTLGSGKFGDVLQCRHKATKTLYAVKKIFKSTIKQYGMVDQLVQQLKIHYSLDNLNIVKLYGHFQDHYHIFLLMEYLDGNILMDLKNRQEDYISDIIFQTLSAVEHIHRRQIAHRDIKPENIILSHGLVKLCDFGWAANCDTGMKKTFCGTLDYVSPQILEERQYSITVDLWSIGVLTFELLTGFAPFNQPIPKMKINKIKNIDKQKILFPPHISNQAKDFINGFLKKDPTQRMSIRQAFNHPFIQRYRKQTQQN